MCSLDCCKCHVTVLLDLEQFPRNFNFYSAKIVSENFAETCNIVTR